MTNYLESCGVLPMGNDAVLKREDLEETLQEYPIKAMGSPSPRRFVANFP